MKTYTDQLGSEVVIQKSPSRIISLVPSQTELLHDLELDQEVVGVTKFCVHPPNWRAEKTIVGGTKRLRMPTIDELNPDLIIANKEENRKEDIEDLRLKYPVWVSDINNIDDAVQMIKSVGLMTDRIHQSESILDSISKQRVTYKSPQRGRAAYFIWKEPWMVAAGGTFIDAMMREAGFTNVFSDNSRYPIIELKDLIQSKPEHLLLSTEPFPFKASDIAALQALFPSSKVQLVDGEMFSWYGSRLSLAYDYFSTLE